jgi:hypothetical protein
LPLLGVFCHALTNIDALWKFLQSNDTLCFASANRKTNSVQDAQKRVSLEQGASFQVNSDHGEYRGTMVSTGQDVGLYDIDDVPIPACRAQRLRLIRIGGLIG